MIVVDANVVLHLVFPGPGREEAMRILKADPRWSAPPLWRSEFRHVLSKRIRRGETDLPGALAAMAEARALLDEDTHDVTDRRVLRLAHESGCTAYDCEYVSLAELLGVRLVTEDRQVLRAFPDLAVSMRDFSDGGPAAGR